MYHVVIVLVEKLKLHNSKEVRRVEQNLVEIWEFVVKSYHNFERFLSSLKVQKALLLGGIIGFFLAHLLRFPLRFFRSPARRARKLASSLDHVIRNFPGIQTVTVAIKTLTRKIEVTASAQTLRQHLAERPERMKVKKVTKREVKKRRKALVKRLEKELEQKGEPQETVVVNASTSGKLEIVKGYWIEYLGNKSTHRGLEITDFAEKDQVLALIKSDSNEIIRVRAPLTGYVLRLNRKKNIKKGDYIVWVVPKELPKPGPDQEESNLYEVIEPD